MGNPEPPIEIDAIGDDLLVHAPRLKSAILASSGATTASHAAEGAASAAEYLRETRTAAVGALGILPPTSAARTAPPSSATASYDPKWQALRMGATLQCVEAATLGMPFEVWKTHMARNRTETTMGALRTVHAKNGGGLRGVLGFWTGTGPKMIESASKGAILMLAKESIKERALEAGCGPVAAGVLAGAGGGVAQVSVMGPCTFLVTARVTSAPGVSLAQHARRAWGAHGVKGFYPGGVPIAFRQATNWASRQGFTDAVREGMKRTLHEDPATAKLSVAQELTSGMIGGFLACWNHPFEVARVEAQARAAAGEPKIGMVDIFRRVMAEHGVAGLFKGVVPRVGLGIWQTTFMVTGANIIREHLGAERQAGGHQ